MIDRSIDCPIHHRTVRFTANEGLSISLIHDHHLRVSQGARIRGRVYTNAPCNPIQSSTRTFAISSCRRNQGRSSNPPQWVEIVINVGFLILGLDDGEWQKPSSVHYEGASSCELPPLRSVGQKGRLHSRGARKNLVITRKMRLIVLAVILTFFGGPFCEQKFVRETQAIETSCSKLEIGITPDDYPYEISWQLSLLPSTLLLEGDASGAAGVELCAAGTYSFIMRDNNGDGICCAHGAGSYRLILDDVVIHTSTGQYGLVDQFEFQVPPNSPSPPSPPSPSVPPPPKDFSTLVGPSSLGLAVLSCLWYVPLV